MIEQMNMHNQIIILVVQAKWLQIVKGMLDAHTLALNVMIE